MKHKLYEKTIFSGSQPDPAAKRALQQHLGECDSCYELARNWERAEAVLLNSEALAPEPGFSTRWQLRFNESRMRQERRQSIFVLSASGVGALGFLLSFFLLWAHVLKNGLFQPDWMMELAFVGETLGLAFFEPSSMKFTVADGFPVILVMGLFAFIGAAGTCWLKLLHLFVKNQGFTAGT